MSTPLEAALAAAGAHHLTSYQLDSPEPCAVCHADAEWAQACSHCSFRQPLCEDHWPHGGA